jgi:hypothetical protein
VGKVKMKAIKLPNGVELRETSDGDKYWYLNGTLHREGGPAIEYINGDQSWYLNGKCHREDGPAIDHVRAGKVWYLNGVYLPCTTQEEFERLMRLKAFW